MDVFSDIGPLNQLTSTQNDFSVRAVLPDLFDLVKFGVDPVEDVTFCSVVDSQAGWMSDPVDDERPSPSAVQPGNFDLGVVTGVRPEHSAILRVQSDRRGEVQP